MSTREKPVLPVQPKAQIEQDYFKLPSFRPAEIPSLAFEEAVSEKIRAATQRSKIRDLDDLSELARLPLNHGLVRSLAVLKLWNSGGQGLDYEVFKSRIEGAADYDVADLRNLLRRDEAPDLKAMITRVVQGFQFLRDLTDAERVIAGDAHHKAKAEAEALVASLQAYSS